MANIYDIINYEKGEFKKQDEAKFFQKIINDGSVWHLQGAYGRRAMVLLEIGKCELGPTRFKDFYGNTVPSRFDVTPGTIGAPLSTR